MHLSVRRVLVSVALAAALAGLSVAPVLAAGGPFLAGATPVASSGADPGLAAQVWSLLRTIWPEGGCTIDPSGQCGGMSPRPGARAASRAARKSRPDGGCTIDPGGQCGGTAPRPGTSVAARVAAPQPIAVSGGVLR
jgi:hypothetical protein